MSESLLNGEMDEWIDDLMGGEENPQHSPDENVKASTEQTESKASAPEEKEDFTPYSGDDYSFTSDSAEETEKTPDDGAPEKESAPETKEEEPVPDINALQQEIANYKKRLHDTQKAMHEANTQKAELQKELDSIRQRSTKKGDDDDNWFSDDTDEDAGKIEKELAEIRAKSETLETRQEEYQQELRRQQWVKDAEKVAAEKEDFVQLVYEKLEPMLDEETGDPMVRALYMQQEDKTPAGAYEFAKKLFGMKEKLSGTPETKTTVAEKPQRDVRGKAGLDRMNSAEFAESPRSYTNMVDEVFG